MSAPQDHDPLAPPPAPPPYPGGHGGGGYHERPSSGALVAIGVLNIIFALICGCWGGLWTGSATYLSADISETQRSQMLQQVQEGWDDQVRRQAVLIENEAEREQVLEWFDALEENGIVPALTDSFLETGQSEPVKQLALTGTIALILKLLLFVASIMLLARVKVSRTLCLVSLGGILLLTIYEGVLHNDAANELRDTVLPAIESVMERAAGAGANDIDLREETGKMAVSIPTYIAVVSILIAVIAGIYPLIAFLVLWLSAGVKAALGLDRTEFGGASY